MKGRGRKISGVPLVNGRKERDEDLLLFKELHKREKERLASLLQPVSDEFEPNIGGNLAILRISSGRKSFGFSENEKNDYDWLKTPPATPLFPSLEMEANATENVVQREIPIIQPLSRFADNSGALKGSTVTPIKPTPSSKRNKIPQRSATPSQKSRISSSTENKNNKVVPPTLNQKNAPSTTDQNKNTNVVDLANSAKPVSQKDSPANFLTSNQPKDIKTTSANRGVSPSVRSTIPAQIPGLSNDTPPNLRTDRSSSSTRGRPAANPTVSFHQRQDPTPTRSRRQSCSPTVTRGRKESNVEGNSTSQKGKTVTGNNFGAQIFGSRMVDKVMNARKLGAEEREGKIKLQGASKSASSSATASPNHIFGRMMSKTSMDMAFKHMEQTRERTNSRPFFGSIASGRSSSSRN